MASPSMPKAVKKSGSSFSTSDASAWIRRALWAVGIMLLVLAGVLLLTGAAVRADVGCTSCHTMAPYIEASAESGHPSLECSACHASSGVTGMMVDGARAMSWVSSSEVSPVAYDDSPCVGCHANVLEETIESRGIRVRHSDFSEMPCTRCHSGTGHALEDRFYRVAEMDDCMQCHRSSIDNLDTCETCHVPDADAERREGNTTWRVTHGAGWEQAHGMGDLRTCKACHEPSYCIECHGVQVPHPTDWLVGHGAPLTGAADDRCATCHETEWCTSCHQVEMPHPPGFLPLHGPEAEEIGEEVCHRCHDAENCNECHIQSSHPNVPGVGMGHEG